MSRTTAAIKLLLVSLPLVRSLPQVLPPYPTITTTTTETVYPTPTEEPEIQVDTIPVDSGIGDGTWGDIPPPEATPSVTIPLDPIFIDPIYVDPIAPEWPYNTIYPNPESDETSVSVETLVKVVQPLLDIIQDLLPDDEIFVHPYNPEILPAPFPATENFVPEPAVSETPEIVVTLSESGPTDPPVTGPAFPDTSAKIDAVPGPVFPDAPSSQLHGADHHTPAAQGLSSTPLKKRDNGSWLGGIGDSIISAMNGGAKTNEPTAETAEATETAEDLSEHPSSGAFRHDVLQLPAEDPISNGSVQQQDIPALSTEVASLALVNRLTRLILRVFGLSFLPKDRNSRTGQEIKATLMENNGLLSTANLFAIVDKVVRQELQHSHSGTPTHSPTKRDAGTATDAMMKFYSSLQSAGEESVDSVTALADTLKAYFKELDAPSQTALLASMNDKPAKHELVKRERRKGRGRGKGRVETDPRKADWDGYSFIRYYTAEFHYFFPVLVELDPILAQGLADIFTDPNIPVPPYDSLRMNNLPDRLRQFVLDTYVFLQIIQDPTIRVDELVLIFKNLFEGVEIRGLVILPQPNVVVNAMTVSEESTPTDTASASSDGSATVSNSVSIALSTGTSTSNSTPIDNLPIALFPTIVPDTAPPSIQPIGDFGIDRRRIASQILRRSLHKRQHDEGISLDDASKLGPAALHAIVGPAGTLDPMGQYNAQPQAAYAPAKSEYRNSPRPGHRGSNPGYNAAPQADPAYSPYEPDYQSPDYEPADAIPPLANIGHHRPGKYSAPAYVNDAVDHVYGAAYTDYDDGDDAGAGDSQADLYAELDGPAVSYCGRATRTRQGAFDGRVPDVQWG